LFLIPIEHFPESENGTMSTNRNPKWTIMVYLAGDNDLTSHCVTVLQQLEAVKYCDDICVLACFEANTPWPKGSRYVAVNCKHQEVEKVLNWELHNDLITFNGGSSHYPSFCHTYRNENHSIVRPTVAEGLRHFINWTMENHGDSDNFMLVLFGHGPIVVGKTFLAAENPASFLRLEDLQDLLSDHFGGDNKRLSILAFQNCVMNGIETAYEIRNHADYLIGSQGLVLAMGWPYDKMIKAVAENPDAKPKVVAEKLLKVCARNMLDFTLMDRSSEQSVCKLKALRNSHTITTALRCLSTALIKATAFELDKDKNRVLVFPQICDALRLARLEAQSYWCENFVDLYDFCERLIRKCDDLVKAQNMLLKQLGFNGQSATSLINSELLQMTTEIIRYCIMVLYEIKELVPCKYSWYIGSELQYSHGLSIYFPWTLPLAPYFSTEASNGKEFELQTAFDTYSKYSFVRDSGWAEFLLAFYRATLRNVRRGDRTFKLKQDLSELDNGLVDEQHEVFHGAVFSSDLQKSSPDTGRIDGELTFTVKNYPRRNYLSPSDCPRRMSGSTAIPGSPEFEHRTSPPVSPLGWNFPALVRGLITKPEQNHHEEQPFPAARRNGTPQPGTNYAGLTNKALEKSRQ
jgi:hypothetical protein